MQNYMYREMQCVFPIFVYMPYIIYVYLIWQTHYNYCVYAWFHTDTLWLLCLCMPSYSIFPNNLWTCTGNSTLRINNYSQHLSEHWNGMISEGVALVVQQGKTMPRHQSESLLLRFQTSSQIMCLWKQKMLQTLGLLPATWSPGWGVQLPSWSSRLYRMVGREPKMKTLFSFSPTLSQIFKQDKMLFEREY